MRTFATIISQPLAAGVLISVAAHGWLLHRELSAPASLPIPHLETGRTVVQLTLLPSPPPAVPAHETTLPSAEATPPVIIPEAAPLEAIPDEVPVERQEHPVPEEPILPQPETTASAPDASAESVPNTEEQTGVYSDAFTTSAFRPEYPRVSRQRGEEGTVVLAVTVLSTGNAGNVEVLHSSGYRRLDRAAIEGARQTRFTAALEGDKPVDSVIELTFTFRLTHD